MVRLLSLLAFLVVFVAYAAKPRDTITVCQVLRDPLKFNGAMVTVRGLFISTDEGAWLKDENCDGVLVAGGYTWPVLLGLKSPSPGDPTILHRIDFKLDVAASKKFRAIVGRNQGRRILATYTGMFETWEKLEELVHRDRTGKLTGLAFGHMGAAPAQLIVKTVSVADVVVLPAHPRQP